MTMTANVSLHNVSDISKVGNGILCDVRNYKDGNQKKLPTHIPKHAWVYGSAAIIKSSAKKKNFSYSICIKVLPIENEQLLSIYQNLKYLKDLE